MNKIAEIVELYTDAKLLQCDGYDDCCIGIDTKLMRLVYDADMILEVMMKEQRWSYESAMEYFHFNIEGAYMGAHTPIFVWTK